MPEGTWENHSRRLELERSRGQVPSVQIAGVFSCLDSGLTARNSGAGSQSVLMHEMVGGIASLSNSLPKNHFREVGRGEWGC